MNRPRQQGAALLVAMLTVALVAAFATAAVWRQWRGTEVEAADRARVQSGWILTGALDWARLILREDRNSDGTDSLSEPWAVPLKEARLSTFLAADRNNNMDAGTEADDVFLSGEISDLQAKLNLNNLVAGNAIQPQWLESFQRLFDVLGLPQAQLDALAENLRFAGDTSADNRNAARSPLKPQRIEQLAWLGVPADVIATLAPYVTLIPSPVATPVNLNTAPAEAIYAVGRKLSLADASRLVAERAQQHFGTLADAARLVPGASFDPSLAGVSTSYFEVRGRLRLDDAVVEERSMVRRMGLTVRTLRRERGSFAATLPPPVR
jgi:general secretion pathway protein K